MRGLGRGLLVQEAGEVGSHVYEVVQGLAVRLRVCGLLAGIAVVFGLSCVCGHERNKKIVGVKASRLG